MFKIRLFIFLFFTCIVLSAAKAPRITEISGKNQQIRDIEIVVSQAVPVVRTAAAELQQMLSTVTGEKIPVVKRPSGGKRFSIILGDCTSLQSAGLDVKKLPPEGYYMVRRGNTLYLAGADDPKQDPLKRIYIYHKRGTLSAVYDFLERFAGVRFYFPGRYGTIVPEKKGIFLPEKLRVIERPDRAMRTMYFGPLYRWYDETTPFKAGFNLQQLRMRYSESAYPFCHGLNSLDFVRRFGKTNPEFFALQTNGKRFIEGERPGFKGQLCFSSGIREQIFRDAKRYFQGAKPQEVTGKHYWSESLAFGKNFCVMPQDWMYWCNCEKCRKIAPGGRDEVYSNPKYRQAVSDFMWRFTSEIAERLAKEGFDCVINQMAYSPYDNVPNGKIAPNVQVQVAVNGLGGDGVQDKNDIQKMKVWAEKMGHPVMLWTYAQGKHMRKNIPGIPPMMPRHLGRFIDRSAPYFDGGFFEAETDYFIFGYLNFFIVSKKLWNSSLDTEKLLDEHYSVMFGKGAPMMKKFYETLEDIWTKKILGTVEMTSIGPVTKVPEAFEIWTKIYSPAQIAAFRKLFDAARSAARADRGAVERIEFIRKQMLGPIEEAFNKYHNAQKALDFWQLPLNTKGYLRTLSGAQNEVSTSVEAQLKGKELTFLFECQEPAMKNIRIKAVRNGDRNLWEDSAIELFLNPSGDRKNYYQIIINAAGFVTMYKHAPGAKSVILPTPMIKTAAWKKADSWGLSVTLPVSFAGLDKRSQIPVNFGRNRALTDGTVKHKYYHWNPITKPEKGFHDLRIWGVLTRENMSKNLVQNDSFADGNKNWHLWCRGGAKGGSAHTFDKTLFISGGQSLHFKNKEGNSMNAVQFLKGLKPNTRYQLSYFFRCKDLKGKYGAGAYIHFSSNYGFAFPKNRINGTREWSREVHTFTTPAAFDKKTVPSVGLWIWNAGGEAWFDCIRIEEIK